MEELKLEFTGKGFIILELEQYGPMQFKWENKHLTSELLRVILNEMGNTSEVNSFTEKELKQFKNNLN